MTYQDEQNPDPEITAGESWYRTAVITMLFGEKCLTDFFQKRDITTGD